MNVIGCAVKFGLGPVGKLSTIISETKKNIDNINWYACGDELDLNIFENDVFKEKCWSKAEETIKKFVDRNRIELAVVILDPDMAILLEKFGVKVFYVDSLPFLWTDSDLVPFNITKYFAQKCVNMNDRAIKIMNKVKNLEWIDPIIPNIDSYMSIEDEYKVVINLGGMHSPYGRGEEYVKIVLINLLKQLLKKYRNKDIIVTSGSDANKAVKEILNENGMSQVKVETLKQEKFGKVVLKCELFFTSPGMTTIYETCRYDKDTIILPPQNLSQFYNIEFSKKLIKRLKVIYWNKYELEFEYLKQYLNFGEEKVVEIIYENIKEALKDKEYQEKLGRIIDKTIDENFEDRKTIVFERNGASQILEEILKNQKNCNT